MPTLNWIGKEAVVNHHHAVPFQLLRDVPSLACGEPGSGNLIVQGDNLTALKALLPYYAGQVKCIYIDPPYNTGNEGWAYNDNVNSPEIRRWLGQVVGKEGETLDRHDRWLCMMYPRLALLWDFLCEDGAIFISIGKDEVGNLRILCDALFGADKHLETFIWVNEGNTENAEAITAVHEYVLAYARNPARVQVRTTVDPNVADESKLLRDFAENSVIKNGAANPPSIITLPVGFPCEADQLHLPSHPMAREVEAYGAEHGYLPRSIKADHDIEYPVRLDDLTVDGGVVVSPCRIFSGWSSARKFRNFICGNLAPLHEDDGSRLSFFLTRNGVPYYRREARSAHFVPTVLRNMGSTEKDSNMLERMGIEFDYPKPVSLIRYLVGLICGPGEIVLDSFAGSGTTGHAVMSLGENRKVVLVELEEANACRIKKRLSSICEGYSEKRKKRTVPIPGLGGGFRFCELGEPLYDEAGHIRREVKFADLARHVYFAETGEPLPRERVHTTPLLGVHRGRAVCLLYNGILRDKSPEGGNALTHASLAILREACVGHAAERIVVYGTSCRLSAARRQREGIEFKQIPYQLQTP